MVLKRFWSYFGRRVRTVAFELAIFDQSYADKHVLFVTNNATKSRKNYKKKFDKLGIQAEVVRSYLKARVCNEFTSTIQDEVFGSAYATAVYLSSIMKLPKDKKVFVVGMSGLEEELAEEGISFIGGTVSTFVVALSALSRRRMAGSFLQHPRPTGGEDCPRSQRCRCSRRP